MIAGMLAGDRIGLAFELFYDAMHDVGIIDLFAIPVHDPPATLDLESEATQGVLMRDLRVVVFVSDPERRMPTLVVRDVNDVLHGIIDP